MGPKAFLERKIFSVYSQI